MASPESIFPSLNSWWRSRGAAVGEGASLPPVASTTPYDEAAAPAEPRRFTFELTYSASSAATVDLRINWFSADRRKTGGPFDLTQVPLEAAQARTATAEVVLPDNQSPRWLPSIAIPSDSGEVMISSLKVYETPTASGPAVTVWTGADEVAASVTVWDGTREISASLEIQA